MTAENRIEHVTRNDLIKSVLYFCTNPPPEASTQLK